ncbi:MAG: PEP-CTERM sorting domain-containing protein [Phycisphaeraceae bacterium]|nr:PEP-CTERM sorting domain-containing protein [Phycisphaeraceae bacterium]
MQIRSLLSHREPLSVRPWIGAIMLVGVMGSAGHAEQVTVEIDGIDLGAINRIGDLSWSHTLGTTWNENFSIGGIVGKQNATVIPEVSAFGKVIIPRVTADTRTGARFSGNVSGGTGLVFFADFQASGLAPGSMFDFRPAVELPTEVSSGEFFRLSTTTGMQSNPAFNQQAVDLPSFEAGMDFFFDLELRSRVEGGLFPIVPYGATNFNPPPIHVDQNLLKFEFDLDPKSNPDSQAGIPPRFVIFEDTLFESTVEFLDDSASVVNKQISVDVGVKDQPGVTRRLDIGEVQLVNPFGVGQSILGGSHPNLTISTSSSDSSVGYSFETPLLRLGLDLDGIAAFLGTGQSFTRLEEEIGNFASITLDLIDIKYGPEIGYRETVDVRPDFEVTLNFDRTVAVRNGTGIELVDSISGMWSDLPSISLLGDDPVEVTASFDALTGEMTKRGAMFLTDYLELTLLELESLKVLDTVELSLPPLLRKRTSVLGALLGEVELEVLNQTQMINPILLDGIGSNFTMTAVPSQRVYRPEDAPTHDPTDANEWRNLADHTAPDSLADKVLVFGRSEQAVQHVGELAPMTFVEASFEPRETVTLGQLFEEQTGRDQNSMFFPARNTPYDRFKVPLKVRGIEVPAGSELATGRRWELGSIRNDGLIHNDGRDHMTFMAADGLLQITGEGTIEFNNKPGSVVAQTLFHGEGHTLRFAGVPFALREDFDQVSVLYQAGIVALSADVDVPVTESHSRMLDVSQTIDNAGRIVFDDTDPTIALSNRFVNRPTGSLEAHNGSTVTLNTPRIEQDGLFAARGAESQIVIEPTLLAPAGMDGVFEASDGGAIVFSGSPTIGEETFPNTSPTAPPLSKRQTFRAAEGGLVEFEDVIQHRYDVQSRFEIEPGGELVLNGIRFEPLTNIPAPSFAAFAAIASDFIDIVNHGTLTVASGENLLFLTPPGSLAPGAPPPTPEPVVTPLNLVNTGEVVISGRASFGFEVEIEDYAEGGAKFDQGAWTLVGATPPPGEHFSNLTDPESLPHLTAVLDLRVVQVSSEDSYIGTVFFGEGNNIQDFDTQLAINASDITLHGRAYFPYLNTMRENRGSLQVRTRNFFFTEGDLLNSGHISVQFNSALIVDGHLVVDEGSLFVDLTSTLDVGSDTIEVIGGSIVVQQSASALNVNTPWIVREKWVGEDEDGNDIVLPATVDYGDAWFSVIGPSGDILVDGAEARFEPLAGLDRIEGRLALTGGHVLELGQHLNNIGQLEVTDSAQLLIDGVLESSGELIVGPEGYIHARALNLLAGSAVLDGVIDAPLVSINEAVSVTGSTRISGALINHGILNVGSSPGIMEVFDGLSQSGDGMIVLEILGQVPGESHDRLVLHHDSTIEGTLRLEFGGEFTPAVGRQWLLVDAAESVRTGLPSIVSWLIQDNLEVLGLDPFAGDFDPDEFKWHAEDLLIGGFDDLAIMLTFHGGAGHDLIAYAVPEPATLWLLGMGTLLALRRRNR